ncbi:MAG: 4-hydroxy-tetrahydrodipicolinate reductase [Ruminococcaceae bacterium]|nr:4-hydroxy-tetrahydrodipicolinate reductase [Oscillospiraceae bacterium]
MINIMLCGCNGKMGQVIARLLSQDDSAKIVCGVDVNTEQKNSFPVVKNPAEFTGHADVVVDFSHPDMLAPLISYCGANRVPAVVCTTGLSETQIDSLHTLAKQVPVFFSANMSLGVNLLVSLVKKAAAVLEGKFDIEIIEKHHNQKIDAPSGTALMIADEINDTLKEKDAYVYDRHSVRKKRDAHEIGIHAVRGGTIVGEHTVLFAGNDEVLEITHKASSKEVFAVGAISAAKFLPGKQAGMYDMKDLISLS